jgi:DMSO/TMAO reductase YedYZ molybdopterin-dependent catalytic subunit
MHPQVMLAWMMNDQPLAPEYGAPMRLIGAVPLWRPQRQGDHRIQFTATSFPPQKGWQA